MVFYVALRWVARNDYFTAFQTRQFQKTLCANFKRLHSPIDNSVERIPIKYTLIRFDWISFFCRAEQLCFVTNVYRQWCDSIAHQYFVWPNVFPYVLILLVRLLLFFSTWAHHRSSNGIFLWLVKIIKLQNIKNDVVISHVRNFFAQIWRFSPFHLLFSTGLCYFFLTIHPPQHIINFDKWR